MTVAVWQTEPLLESFVCFRISMSLLMLRIKNSRTRAQLDPQVSTKDRDQTIHPVLLHLFCFIQLGLRLDLFDLFTFLSISSRLRCSSSGGLHCLENAGEKLLRCTFVQVECNLVGHQCRVLAIFDEFVENVGDGLRIIKEDETLGHTDVVRGGKTTIHLY